MATRLYLPPPTVGIIFPITPNASSDWEAGGASFVRALASRTKSNKAFANQNFVDTSATANRDSIIAQFIYALPIGTVFATTQTVKGRVLAFENTATHNLRSQCIIRVIASDETTIRATLLAGDLSTGTANPTSEWGLSAANRQMPRGASGVAIAANYTSVLGDCLVIEQGFRKHSTTNGNGSIRYGDNNATDLPEDETTTADNNSWIEFSANFPIHETVIITAGDLALGSTAVSTAISGSVATTKSDLALGSTAATARAGSTPTTVAGNLTLGTTAATVRSGSTPATVAGNLSLDGTVVEARAGATIATIAGNLALNDTVESISAGALLSLLAGDLALQGQGIQTVIDSLIAAAAGNLDLGSTVASVFSGEGGAFVQLIASDISLTGGGVSMSAGSLATLTASDLALLGQPIAAQAGSLIVVTPDTLILDGGDVGVSALTNILLTSSDLSLDGGVSQVTAGSQVFLTASDLALLSTLVDVRNIIFVPPSIVLIGTRDGRVLLGQTTSRATAGRGRSALTGKAQDAGLIGALRRTLTGRSG